jgi:hypothetical protein
MQDCAGQPVACVELPIREPHEGVGLRDRRPPRARLGNVHAFDLD